MYGDEHVVRREFLGVVPYRHHGIELPGGRIAENSPPGVRIVGFEDFAGGRPTRVVSRDLSPAGRDQAVERALSGSSPHKPKNRDGMILKGGTDL